MKKNKFLSTNDVINTNFCKISVCKSKYNNKIQLSKKLNQILEQMIINNPNQWIWTHNRWQK